MGEVRDTIMRYIRYRKKNKTKDRGRRRRLRRRRRENGDEVIIVASADVVSINVDAVVTICQLLENIVHLKRCSGRIHVGREMTRL